MTKRLLVLMALLVMGASSQAAVFTFSQSGFRDGSTVVGSFTATDSDHNGWIETYKNEVSSFSMNFTAGSSFPNNFSSTSPFVMKYKLGTGYIGDDPGEYIASANVFDPASDSWGAAHVSAISTIIRTMLGCAQVQFCSKAFHATLDSIQIESSDSLVRVQAVPLPGAALLFSSAILGLAGWRRLGA